MHRMHHLAAMLTLGLMLSAALAPCDAQAALVRPDATMTYPEIAGGIGGELHYAYDDAAGSGVLNLSNTPYIFDTSTAASSKFAINADDLGRRSQTLTVKLDSEGKLLSDPGNSFELYGEVVFEGQTYSGLLLKGTPLTFGAQDLGSLGLTTTDLFDSQIAVTDGALASLFGKQLYFRFRTDLDSGFAGLFNEDFSAYSATSFLIPQRPLIPDPAGGGTDPAVPEPASLLLMLAGGAGIALRHRRACRAA